MHSNLNTNFQLRNAMPSGKLEHHTSHQSFYVKDDLMMRGRGSMCRQESDMVQVCFQRRISASRGCIIINNSHRN